jgi:hypothetical protein
MPPFTWPLSQGFDPSGPKKLNEVIFDWKERVSRASTFIAFRLLLPLRLFRSMFAKAFRLVVPRRRRINGKRPAACTPEFRVDVLALSSCSLQIESNARRKRCRCSFEIRGFRRPGNEFRMPCEGPGFRLIQRPIWSGKFELHAHTSRRTVEVARTAGGVFPRSAGRPSPRKAQCSMAHKRAVHSKKSVRAPLATTTICTSELICPGLAASRRLRPHVKRSANAACAPGSPARTASKYEASVGWPNVKRHPLSLFRLDVCLVPPSANGATRSDIRRSISRMRNWRRWSSERTSRAFPPMRVRHGPSRTRPMLRQVAGEFPWP